MEAWSLFSSKSLKASIFNGWSLKSLFFLFCSQGIVVANSRGSGSFTRLFLFIDFFEGVIFINCPRNDSSDFSRDSYSWHYVSTGTSSNKSPSACFYLISARLPLQLFDPRDAKRNFSIFGPVNLRVFERYYFQ